MYLSLGYAQGFYYILKKFLGGIIVEKKLRVGVLGATGFVGQRLVTLLENHPYFDVKVLGASERSAGKKYEDVVGAKWKLTTPIPEYTKSMVIRNLHDIDSIKDDVDFVFCAVDMKKEEIQKIEEDYAKAEVPVVSNNSAHRMTKDVPVIIPEINSAHLEIIEAQKKRLGTKKGFIATKPNCSIHLYFVYLHLPYYLLIIIFLLPLHINHIKTLSKCQSI